MSVLYTGTNDLLPGLRFASPGVSFYVASRFNAHSSSPSKVLCVDSPGGVSCELKILQVKAGVGIGAPGESGISAFQQM